MNKKTYDKYFRRRKNEGLIFISLWLSGFILFRVFPSVFSLIYSFSDFSLFNGTGEYGLMNYRKILTDSSVMNSLRVTLKYSFISVPLRTAAALGAALLLNSRVRGISVFRTVYYIPSVLGSSAAVSVLWKTLFRDDGTVNLFLRHAGLAPVNWLSDSENALLVLALLRAWQFGSSMVIFLAALNSLPSELYEAAGIDGAGKIKKFFHITIPLMTPVIFFNLVTQFGLSMQEFNAPFIITNGGPRGATTLFSVSIYNTAFQLKETGMACAMTWFFFIIISVLISLVFISGKYWVFYMNDSGEKK